MNDSGPPRRGFSPLALVQFLGASSLVAWLTWGLTNYIGAKNNQQQQLNAFINTISEFMINNQLDVQSSPDTLPPVSRAARGFALNTLTALDGVWPVADPRKKEALLKFLYDSQLIGYCRNPVIGQRRLPTATAPVRCTPTRINLRDARLRQLTMPAVGLVLRGINLSYTDLGRSTFRQLDLSHADFTSSNLLGADLRGSLLMGAALRNAFVINADLRGSDLSGADLRGAQLCGADLREVIGLEQVQLGGASFDGTTRLPEGGAELLLRGGAQVVGPDRPTRSCVRNRVIELAG
ncbi:MAG: pentapeptide repeat-containing protein [Synechococcaceae cyanobacterium]|nr:pentapeptide repeat-containing protein [Synechococcaceae cyanobacterium]